MHCDHWIKIVIRIIYTLSWLRNLSVSTQQWKLKIVIPESLGHYPEPSGLNVFYLFGMSRVGFYLNQCNALSLTSECSFSNIFLYPSLFPILSLCLSISLSLAQTLTLLSILSLFIHLSIHSTITVYQSVYQ